MSFRSPAQAPDAGLMATEPPGVTAPRPLPIWQRLLGGAAAGHSAADASQRIMKIAQVRTFYELAQQDGRLAVQSLAASATSGMRSDAAIDPHQLPWLGWAEIRLDHYERYIKTDWRSFPPQAWREMDRYVKPNDIPTALALRQMRSDCWKHQLSITDTTEDTLDMAGGIVFTKGLTDGRAGNPYPTWQCVRPLAFIATMLRDPRLTEPQERPEQIVRLMQAARFLRQLQVDEASAWMYPDPTLAIGGIRASTWDNSLPVDATSMTLLFVVELIKSLDELSAAKNAPAAPTTPK